jgi:hypothetical protein
VDPPETEDGVVLNLTDVSLEQLEEIEQLRLRKTLLMERLAAAHDMAAEREQRIADLRLALFIVRSPRRDDPPPGRPPVDAAGSNGSPPPQAEAAFLSEPVPDDEAQQPAGSLARPVPPIDDDPNGGPAPGSREEPDAERPLARHVELTWNRELNALEGRIPWKLPDDPPRVSWWLRLRERYGRSPD